MIHTLLGINKKTQQNFCEERERIEKIFEEILVKMPQIS